MTRQSIHVNGAQATELTEGKPQLRNDLLDLEGEQLREVLRKSGEDMTNIQTVGKSAGKSARGGSVIDPNNISRQEAFDILFGKGYTPEQIVKEAPPRSRPAPIRKPFGPPQEIARPLSGLEAREKGGAQQVTPIAGKVRTNGGATGAAASNVAPAMKREVMAQTPSTSRATPTGEARIFEGQIGTLPPELHADLEKQAGRKLTNEEAIALDRANAERGMAKGGGQDIGAIREEHRAGLEQKGRPAEKKR